MGNASAATKRTSAKTFISFNISVSPPRSLEGTLCGTGTANLRVSKLRLFLLTAGNPLETLGVRKGWPKRGRWCLFHDDQTEDCELSRKMPLDTGISNTTEQDQSVWARAKMSGAIMRCAKSITK